MIQVGSPFEAEDIAALAELLVTEESSEGHWDTSAKNVIAMFIGWVCVASNSVLSNRQARAATKAFIKAKLSMPLTESEAKSLPVSHLIGASPEIAEGAPAVSTKPILLSAGH